MNNIICKKLDNLVSDDAKLWFFVKILMAVALGLSIFLIILTLRMGVQP